MLRTEFWNRINKRQAVMLAIPLVLILILEIATTSFIPYTRKIVIDALTVYNFHWFCWAVGIAFANSLVLLGVQSLKEWSSQKLSFLGREALMKTIKKKWVNKDGRTKLSNPCARLNDDARLATELALKVSLEIIISVSIVCGLLLSVLKWPLLLLSAVLYSSLSIGIATYFRRPMIDSKYVLSNTEGQHRISLTKISMQQGDFTSKANWEKLRTAYHKYIDIGRNYRMFNAFQSALMYSMPFLIMAPGFFSHQYTLGDVTQGTMTFDLLVLNSTIWVQLYPAITEAQTAFIRVKEFFEEVHNN